MDTSAAIAAIEAAFPEAPLPRTTLRQAQLGDQTMSREITEAEWAREGERDAGVPWPQIDEATLRDCDASLSFLNEEGFVYYLPAYLRAALRRMTPGDGVIDDLIGGAVFHATNIQDNWSRARLKCLSDSQIDAVIGFLHVVRDHGGIHAAEATDALREYWETPEARRRTLVYVP
jgi:hypothetical protein